MRAACVVLAIRAIADLLAINSLRNVALIAVTGVRIDSVHTHSVTTAVFSLAIINVMAIRRRREMASAETSDCESSGRAFGCLEAVVAHELHCVIVDITLA
jgi:hypothetical protein